jgi:hypothetical protein
MAPSRICAGCGVAVPDPYRAPTPELAPDLDLRPGEPTRSTLPHWLQQCPGCGAVAPDLSVLYGTASAIVALPAYRRVQGPDYAVAFLRWAAICQAAGDPRNTGEAFLQAAWAADDAGDEPNAAQWRRLAARAWAETESFELALRQIDALRRAGDFPQAEAAAGRLAKQGPDETTAQILTFQRARIAAKDTGRHLMSSALRPPSHRPHVAHGKSSGKGFFARLFGR